MSNTVPAADRISNKVAVPDPSDKTVWNADNVMTILDKILNGEYVIKLKTWDIAGRPAAPEIGMIGINSEIGDGTIEWYTGSQWQPLGL